MKVSVAVFAYNHDQYIAQALDSILMQQVDFQYEIVVGDDCSQDETRSILESYQVLYPDRVRLLLHTERLGVGGNVFRVLAACQGEYIALLDGDDYWTHSDKLQRQVNFLDNHQDIVLCCHPVAKLDQKTGEFIGIWEPNSTEVRAWNLDDFFAHRYFPHPNSIVYRRNRILIPTWLNEIVNADFVLITLCGDQGLFADLGTESMSVYRLHHQGVWMGNSTVFRLEQSTKTRLFLDKHFNGKYHKKLDIPHQFFALAQAYYNERQLSKSRKHIAMYVHHLVQNRDLPRALVGITGLISPRAFFAIKAIAQKLKQRLTRIYQT